MTNFTYNRRRAADYALKWAYRRNPLFTDFSGIGGNCTNFVSQCIFAGSCVMNFEVTFGWYYLSPEDRAPAWTGVQYLYNFLTTNGGAGPFGREVDAFETKVGDVIQLANSDGTFYHSVLVVGSLDGEPLVAAQSNDAFAKPLSAYDFASSRGIAVNGVRGEKRCDCFEKFYNGEDLTVC